MKVIRIICDIVYTILQNVCDILKSLTIFEKISIYNLELM